MKTTNWWNIFNTHQNKMLYLEAKKTYYKLLENATMEIENGNVTFAEEYPRLEEAWKTVQEWYRRTL